MEANGRSSESDAGAESQGQLPLPNPNPAGYRLANLDKLRLVPAFAVKQLLEDRVEGRRFGHLRHSELVEEADRILTITEEDITSLYESFRYGQRVSFYLYLLPPDLMAIDIDRYQRIIDSLLPGPDSKSDDGDRGAGTLAPNQVTILDQEQLDAVQEIRFRYQTLFHYLDVNEQPQTVLETRYGFLWFEPNLGHLIILSHDEQINQRLLRALAICLGAIPRSVRLPRDVMDSHFSIEQARRLSHYDPQTKIRHSISGAGLWTAMQQEILARDQQYLRPGALYEEAMGDNLTSGLGVNPDKGKIYLTRTLTTSVLRLWGLQRLPALLEDIRALQPVQPGILVSTVECVNRTNLTAEGKAGLLSIIEGLLSAHRSSSLEAPLSACALELLKQLGEKHFTCGASTTCGECDERADSCPNCRSIKMIVDGAAARCNSCSTNLCTMEGGQLSCLAGHITTATLPDALNLTPTHSLCSRVARACKEMGIEWNMAVDNFYISGSTLHWTKKQLLTMISTTNIDTVNAPVHTGSGNINQS